MKKLIAVLPLVIFLLSVAFASAALNIVEANINATTNPGATFSKIITLNNTGASPVSVTFSSLDLACTSKPTEKVTAIVSDMTVPANFTAQTTVLFSIPVDKLACTYHGSIVATGGGFSDSVAADITVNAIPNIDVSNKTIIIMKNLTTVSYLNVAVKNTGNTELNIVYQYSNFSFVGNSLAIGSAGADVIPLGGTHYISIPIATNNDLPDGDYSSTLKINGTVNKAYTLTATLKTPVLSVSLPSFTMPSAERNTTTTGFFIIKNDGGYPLEGISLTTDASIKYKASITGVPDSLGPGSEATIFISAFVPEDEKTTKHEIGKIYFNSDRISRTVPLSLDVTSQLRIDQVTVKFDSSSNTVKKPDEIIDDKDALPGSTFSVNVKVCNKYDDKDFSISAIAGTLTFEGVDDGEDIDGEVTEFDLDGKECKTVTATFDKDKISYLSEEGTYNLVIDFEGDDDEYDISQSDEWTIPVSLYRKDTADIRFHEVSLSPSSANCGGSSNLNVIAYNIGDNDNNAKFRIYSAELGIDINKFFKIGNDVNDDCDAIDNPDDKCIGIDHKFTLSIPSNATAGTYPIEVSAYKEETKQTDSKAVSLQVNCGGISPATTVTPTGGTGGTGTTTTTTTPTIPTGTSAGNVIVTPSPSTTSRTSGTPVKIRDVSGGTSNLWLVGLIAGNVLLVIIIVLVLLSVFRSKQ